MKLSYISNLIQEGKWFDGSKPLSFVSEQEDPDYAPEFILNHREKFKKLLEYGNFDSWYSTINKELFILLKLPEIICVIEEVW